MSRSVSKRSSERITVGSYSTRACSCVRLTATFSTPGSRPRAFSRVPVQSEQCNPPILARKRACLGSSSSAQYGAEEDGSVDENVVFSSVFIGIPRRSPASDRCRRRVQRSTVGRAHCVSSAIENGVLLPGLRAHRSAGLGAAAAGLGAGRELCIPCELLAAGRTAITEIGAQRAEASGELRIARHQARTGLTQGETIEQQPDMGCFSIRATLRETIHERQFTRGLTVLAPLDALLHLWAQLHASTLLHGRFSFPEEMAPPRGTRSYLTMRASSFCCRSSKLGCLVSGCG